MDKDNLGVENISLKKCSKLCRLVYLQYERTYPMTWDLARFPFHKIVSNMMEIFPRLIKL